MAGGGLGDEGCYGGLIRCAGCHPSEGDLFTGDGGGGGFPAQQGAVAPGCGAGICVDFVFELRFAAGRQVAVGLAASFDGVGQGACQVGQGVDGGLPGAQDVAYGALPGVLAVDVGFKAGLVAAQLALQGGGVEVSHPAFGRVGFCALLGCAQQGLGVQGDGALKVHAFLEGVLLVAAVQGHPGVGAALAGGVAGASAGLVLDEGFDPGVFDAQGFGLRAGDQGNVADAALAPDLLGCVYVVHPLVDRVGVVAQGLGQGFDGGGRNGQ